MLKKCIVSFNDLKSKGKKYYCILAILGLVVFCFINTYLNPHMNNAPIYKEFIFIFSLLIEVLSASLESIVLSIIIKNFFSQSQFRNIFLGLFLSVLLVNSVFGIISLLVSIVNIRGVHSTCIIMLLNMILKCYIYIFSIEKSFGKIDKKAGTVGVILLAIEYLVMIFLH